MRVVLALRLQTRSIPIVFVGPPSKLEPSRLDPRATSLESSAKENRGEVLRLAAGYVAFARARSPADLPVIELPERAPPRCANIEHAVRKGSSAIARASLRARDQGGGRVRKA